MIPSRDFCTLLNTNEMKSTIFTFLLLFIGLSTYAQNQDADKPIVIINYSTIGSMDLLDKIPTYQISELNIDKKRNLSSTYLFAEDEKNAGMIFAKAKHEIKVKSQKELNSFFGFNEENDIYVNGYLIEDKTQNISAESIQGIEIVKAEAFRSNKSVLNITMK